jgi:DNA polymerase-3 subunit delta
MWFLYHGPDGVTRDDKLFALKAALGAPDVASLNIAQFDSDASITEIQSTCDSMPFLTDKRLVIVRNWFAKAGAPKRKKKTDATPADDPIQKMMTYLPQVEGFTDLIFCEDDELPETHPLIKLAKDAQSRGSVVRFELPPDIIRWITDRAKAKGADIAAQAAQTLSTRIHRGNKYDRDHFAEDSKLYLRKLDTELNKLAGYANGRRIEVADVNALVNEEDVADIFKFVDAVGARNLGEAYQVVRGVLTRGESPLIIMSMIARQTRNLIVAKEHAQLNQQQLAELIGVHPFAAGKLATQAKRFSLHDLKRIHRATLDADVAIKTGEMEDLPALDVLIAEACRST